MPRRRVARFVIRETLQREMTAWLLNKTSPRELVLLGMGGSGKTQLALECCRQAEEDMGFVATLWVDASSPVSIVQSYNIIARKILKDVREDNDSEATISLVQDTLRD